MLKLLFYTFATCASESSTETVNKLDSRDWHKLFIMAQKGDKKAYEKLLSSLYNFLLKFCKKYLSNEDQVEDCAQDILINIHKAKHTYDPKKPFNPWFFTIAKNKIFDHLRKTRSHLKVTSEETDYELFAQKTLYNQNESSEIAKILNQLNPTLKEAFILTQLSSFSLQEAANKLNISLPAMKLRSSRATLKVKELITKEFENKYY